MIEAKPVLCLGDGSILVHTDLTDARIIAESHRTRLTACLLTRCDLSSFKGAAIGCLFDDCELPPDMDGHDNVVVDAPHRAWAARTVRTGVCSECTDKTIHVCPLQVVDILRGVRDALAEP